MSVTHANRSQAGAVAARTLLALFVVFGLVVLFLPTAPLNQSASAQTSPSPTGPKIQFLNPSGATANSGSSGPGREVSFKSDGVDTAFHLVAWVASMPSNPVVEFKFQGTGTNDPEQTIGTGTLRGTDTFDIAWGSPIPTDGNYNVKAILYSGTTEVSRDVEAIVVNNANADKPAPTNLETSENQGQTVEITYPVNTGPWGAFRKPGTTNPYAGVVDVSTSAGATAVRAYYTTTAPGSEPSWVRCSSTDGEAVGTNAAASDGVRCNLAAGVNPSTVTAISVATGDANQAFPANCAPTATCGEGEDSGDAHRATGYVQVPSSLTNVPATQSVSDDPGTPDTQYVCSGVITTTVLDQVGRKVVGANVDVHAAGPVDNLYFDDPDATGNYQAPDKNNHLTESTVDCESTTHPRPFNTTSGQGQGEHEVVGEGDIKHVETPAAGTNDAGQMKFQLHNRTATPGVTQFTTYYDRDDDDVMCSLEPQADGSIGWGADPGTPAGVSDETGVCSEPSPTPTGSSSASPTTSPSASRSATGSPTSSPTPGTSRTITLIASDENVPHGKEVTLSGRIFSSDASCTDNEFVQITKRVHGTDAFAPSASAQSDADGNYSVTFVAKHSADYQASVSAHDSCRDAASSPVTILVKAIVSIVVNEFRPERGDPVRIVGKVTPKHAGTKVVLQRKKGGRWVKVTTDKLDAGSRYRFVVTADWKGDRRFRVKWNSTDSDHESGKSQNVQVSPRR